MTTYNSSSNKRTKKNLSTYCFLTSSISSSFIDKIGADPDNDGSVRKQYI